jgi:methylated-DNA-[protein]-cysteine S-methyltransferase
VVYTDNMSSVPTFTTTLPSPVGELTLASDGDSLLGLWIAGQKYFGLSLPDTGMLQKGNLPVFKAVRNWLDEYFGGGRPDIAQLPLAPMGSAFRKRVWAVLKTIPYGQVLTYGEVARVLARQAATGMGQGPVSARAVGGAVGHNPISILIPCHRVIGAKGSLTGYAGGLAIKQYLLSLEQRFT